MEFFSRLNLFWKVVLVAAVLFIGLMVLDRTTGAVSKIRGYMFDRKEAATMKQVSDLEKQNTELRKQKEEFERRAVEAESKNAIYEARAEELGGKILAEQVKTDKVLEELKREEAITNTPIDAYTRCVRTRAKLEERKIDASALNCDQYPKPQ